MEGGLFSFLAAASPWWWVALAVAIFVFEMLTFTYYLIWIAIAALIVGLAKWVAPDMGGLWQLTLFAISSILATIIGRYAMKAYRPPAPDTPNLNRRSAQLVGRTVTADTDFAHGEGTVVVDDIRWQATLSAGEARAGDALTVVSTDGMRLICAPN